MDRPRPAEQGFVLITALWLLLLCGAIAALMMLRNHGRSEQAHDEAVVTQADFDADAAVQTVAADLLFRGPASQWAHLPAQGSMRFDGRELTIAITAETGRLDLNSGDPDKIDEALQGLGISANKRAALLKSLAERHAGNKAFSSMAEGEESLAVLDDPCAIKWFTVYSGLSQPDQQSSIPGFGSTLGSQNHLATGAPTLRPGTALRLEISNGTGRMVSAIMRQSGTDHNIELLDWRVSSRC